MKEYKLIFIGDSGIGKSSIINTTFTDNFDPHIQSTIGCAFRRHLCQNKKGKDVDLHVWDTAGQERFRSMITSFFRNANYIIIVYDVSNKTSLINIDTYWMQYIKKHINYEYDDIHFYIVANKIDLFYKESMINEGKLIAEKYGCKFFMTSALSKEGIDDLYNDIINSIDDTMQTIPPDTYMIPPLNQKKKKRRCNI